MPTGQNARLSFLPAYGARQGDNRSAETPRSPHGPGSCPSAAADHSQEEADAENQALVLEAQPRPLAAPQGGDESHVAGGAARLVVAANRVPHAVLRPSRRGWRGDAEGA